MGSACSKKSKTSVQAMKTIGDDPNPQIFQLSPGRTANFKLIRLLALDEKALNIIYEAPIDLELSNHLESPA